MSRLKPPPTATERKKHARWVYGILATILLGTLGSYLGYRLHFKRKIETRVATIRAQGDPTTLTELNDWYRPLPGVEDGTAALTNAFEQVQKPKDLMPLLPLFGDAKLPALSEPLSEASKRAIADCLATNRVALELLRKAARFQTCRYPMDMRGADQALVPHLPKLRSACRLLYLDALSNASVGAMDEAGASIECALDLADSLTNQPMIISFLFRMTCYAEAQQVLERVLTLGPLNDTRLRSLETAFARIELVEPLCRALIGERCFGRYYFVIPINELGRALGRLDNEDYNTFGRGMVGFGLWVTALQGRLDKDQLFYLDCLAGYLDLVDLPLHDRLQASSEIQERVSDVRNVGDKKRFLLFSGMLLPSLGKVVVKDAGTVAVCRLTRTVVAIERYRAKRGGALPNDLSQLAPELLAEPLLDPFVGLPLRYRQLAQGYLVYSVGPDGEDNHGRDANANGAASDGSDLVFTVTR